MSSPSYALSALSLTGALVAYTRKNSVPSLLAGSFVSFVFFYGGQLLRRGNSNGLVVSFIGAVILLSAGFVRARATEFEKTVPLVLTGLGLLSTGFFGAKLAGLL
ncbi:hypothetical protein CAS74_003692 [Pichia kudriavzevii]|uniref:TMEM14 protein n=1 Tax=Pichia kudriavzevii TaxID=4909 RepID=A0A099P636_PICKU|nr:uncharacterized protein C5L36_0B05950 [Pichia kudriavzevii]AWU75349.1 hypothetical protein C5L36_0B05950 [Pichia kudriavzevii]KGK39739.1 hypothetical protein JL09_g1002 [Pichia kudriavzevii]OUT21571.1 hypothetical protein CAS74_003692 [Pichia kudriavzevii]